MVPAFEEAPFLDGLANPADEHWQEGTAVVERCMLSLAMAARPLRLLPASLVALLVMGAAPPEFRGCGGDDLPPDGVPLPFADGGACVIDDDCAADVCMDVRCLAGSCLTVAPLRDGDGDGHAPPPCGDDCDDSRSEIFAGALERCDGIDNDCDGMIDDGAPRSDRIFSLAMDDAQSVVVPWNGGFLVTQLSGSALWGRPVSVGGELGTPVEIMRLSMGSRFTLVAGAAAADGRILFVTITDLSAARYVVVRPTADGAARVVEGPASTPLRGDTPVSGDRISALEIIAFGAGWAIAVDRVVAGASERAVTVDPMVAPAISVPLTTFAFPTFGLATDGTNIVVSDDADTVHFFSPDGALVASHVIPARLPAGPLASGSGRVVVVYPDAFNFNLYWLDTAGPSAMGYTAPFGGASDEVRIGSRAGLVLVTRANSGGGGATVQALRSDLTTYEGEPLTFSVRPTRVSFADSGGTVGILGASSSMMNQLGVLMACGGP